MRSPDARASLILVLVCALLTATSALAKPPSVAALHHAANDRALRALTRVGYVDVRTRCSVRRGRATRCSWDATRAYATCAGTLIVDRARRRGRWVRFRESRCDPVLFGFNTYTNDLTVDLQRRTGATVRRLIVPWSSVQPAPGVWNWGDFDQEYRLAVAAGMRPLLIAVAAPCWARTRGGCLDAVVSGPPDPENEPDWSEYVRRLAERYPAALGIEIWNEPNLTQVFSPKPDPIRYARLLAEAYETIKGVRPDMPVISGGLLAYGVRGESSGGMGDVTFLEQMLAAGAASHADAIGIHPYPQDYAGTPMRWDPVIAERTLGLLRVVKAAHGAATLPFWVTEVGESTGTQSGFPQAVTPKQQATDLVRVMRAAVRDRDVRVVVIHTLSDERADAGQTTIANVLQPAIGFSLFYNGVGSGFGVFDAEAKAKPAACAMSRELGGTLSC